MTASALKLGEPWPDAEPAGATLTRKTKTSGQLPQASQPNNGGGNMKVYLAGPMRGIPEFNFPAFYAAANRLRGLGYEVFSPAERDNERHGTDISKGNAMGDEDVAAKEHGFNLREALGIDLAYICAHAQVIALLPGWENSKGAFAEYAAARALGLEVIKL